jgi:signal transduction histidine kinase
VTILAGILFGIMRDIHDHFAAASIVLALFATFHTFRQLQPRPTTAMRLLVLCELALMVGATMSTGGLASPFVLTPVTGLLLAGYVWGRRAAIGTLISGSIAAGSTILMQAVDATNRGSAGQIAVVYLLCGALGAFTRNLIAEIESNRAAAIDQAAEMATANELLVSLHGLAQTLPASFDLPEVVDSMRQRLRSLLQFSALVVLVHDDAESAWTVELAEGVRLGTRLVDRELPQPLQRALTSMHPVLITDRIANPDEDGFAALGRSGMYMALRARGALVGLIALEDVAPNAYGPEQRDLMESLSSLLALSIDNARWFARLRTLGAEAERARIARELHDRVAQSLAYVAFELERMHSLPGDKEGEISELRVVVRDIVRELRQTIYQLRANVSEAADITEVASVYLEKFADRTGIETHWEPSTAVALPYRIEQEMWRIGQEALVNIERHSGASEVTVRWEVRDSYARLEIIDDGIGFEPDAVRGEHYGLVGMRERADAIGASLTIERASVRGTRVAVEVAVTSQMTTTQLTSVQAGAERRTA